MAPPRTALAYGLLLESLPLLLPTQPDEPSRLGSVRWELDPSAPARPGEDWRDEGESSLVIAWSDWAEYRVEVAAGRGAVRVRLSGTDEETAALGFLISVLPLSLPLFDLEPLHGSAVGLGGLGAVLILGDSGAGKSTLASALQSRGFGAFADDACAVDERGRLWPGPPLVAPRGSHEAPLYRYDSKPVVAAVGHDAAAQPVVGCVLLDPSPVRDVAVQPLEGREAFVALLRAARAPAVLTAIRRPLQLRAASVLAHRPVARVRYQAGIHDVDQVCQRIVGWAEVALASAGTVRFP